MKSKKYEITIKGKSMNFEQVQIRNSDDASSYARNFYHDDLVLYESMFLILLDRGSNTIGYAKISQGGVCGTVMDGRIICKYAIDSLANAVILVHNHPSGNATPSVNDVEETNKVRKMLGVFDIRLLDHIILTESSHYSFADEK